MCVRIGMQGCMLLACRLSSSGPALLAWLVRALRTRSDECMQAVQLTVHSVCGCVEMCVFTVLQMLELGDKLIKAGVLYADDTPVEQMREVSWQLQQ